MACAFPRCSFSTTIDSQGPHPASCQGCLDLFTFSFFSSTRADSVILSRLLPSHTWRQFCMNFFCPFHPVACGHTEGGGGYTVRAGRGSQCPLPKTSLKTPYLQMPGRLFYEFFSEEPGCDYQFHHGSSCSHFNLFLPLIQLSLGVAPYPCQIFL